MKPTTCFQIEGLKLQQMCGRFVELYFDWEKLPSINTQKEYYLVEIVPQADLLPKELARPNSDGPLFFCLKENVPYRLNLLCVPFLQYQVSSTLDVMPWVDLVSQHENLQKIVWGNIDYQAMVSAVSAKCFEVIVDDQLDQQIPVNNQACCEIIGRPGKIEVKFDNGFSLFQLTSNLPQQEVKASLDFQLEKDPTRLSLATVVHPTGGWRVRAELSPFFQIRLLWQNFFLKRFPKTLPERITGFFRFYENDQITSEVRQFGFSTRLKTALIDHIQLDEWKEKQRKQVREYKLQLQITSAHRELYRHILKEKIYSVLRQDKVVGFSEEEINQAEKNLFCLNPHVSWDQALIELVAWFRVDGRDWHEFQRDNANNLRWEFFPQQPTEFCRCEWVLSDLENNNNIMVVLKSGAERRMLWPRQVVLKPYHASKLIAWWDLDQFEVEALINSQWNVDMKDVGFYLKVHEEYLGDRRHRSDLDCHLVELFSLHQNVYFDVEPDKCFSVEIVARHYQKEMALTPVSHAIVTPKEQTGISVGSGHRLPVVDWYHTSQREVCHQNGKDSANKAKVILHLHLHSPNLIRVEPFREGFLKDKTWPIKTIYGTEVYNPPGEWVLKNCLDSWLPLLRVFRRLADEGVDYQVSLDITPPVAYTLTSPRFKDYMSRYLIRQQAFAKGQLALMKSRLDFPEYIWATERYIDDLKGIDGFYNHELNKDIVGAFRDLELKGYLEIITCTATHGMPAELASIPDTLNTQIALAVRSHNRLFGDRPRGIWLAENSFFPGIEGYLAKESLNFIFVEAEAVLYGSSQPLEEEFNPVVLPGSNLTAFGRSRLGRTQVWDAELGYAGHPDFREYHFRHMGLPLKRITSKSHDDKQPYNPDHGESTARKLAWDFHHKLSEKAHELSQREFQTIPLISCSYDAELFGHHWSEGPVFIEELLREFYRKGDAIGLTTPSHYLVNSGQIPEIMPNPSTWGHEAVHVRWSDPKVIWTYKELERADGVLREYLGKVLNGDFSDFQKQAVEQMAAELIRSQSSDLTFVIMSGDFEEDMQREIQKYLDYFYRLKHLIDNDMEHVDFLVFRKYENNMFPDIPEYYNIR